MKTILIEPLEDRIAVEVDGADEITKGGIVLPHQAQETPSRGTVVAVGPGRTPRCRDSQGETARASGLPEATGRDASGEFA
jgi:co-chaperonin GroES (HSP10)